ncbi:MAG: putative Alkaline phosphatase, partial [Thermoleophilia bacterium]|nr:putative Alkaline phosphatase [Thermoleophilia bacterium]
TWSNGPAYTPTGRFGQAISMDGINQYGSVADNPYIAAPNDFTVDAWFRTTDATAGTKVLVSKGSCASDCTYSIETRSGPDRINAVVYANGAQRNASVAIGTLRDGNWHHVALTVDATNDLRLYTDGSLAAGPIALTGTASLNASPMRIGGQPTGNNFAGDIDEVRFAPRAYDAAAIRGYFKTQRPHL